MGEWGVLSVKNWTRVLKDYDSSLYAQETKLGRIDVYRKSRLNDSPPHFLFALTDNWKPEGTPTWYGSEVVLNRIKAHDLWRDDSFIENWIKEHEKIKASEKRAFKNSIESFLYDFRSEFQKATKDINTSNLKKLHRKEDSHGYCEPRS